MLPKIHRLTKKKDFDAVFKKGKTIKEGFLIFKAAENTSGKSRFGFVVSKKISPKATVRNKVKRRLRKAFLDELKGISKPLDVVVIALPRIEKAEFKELRRAVQAFFQIYV